MAVGKPVSVAWVMFVGIVLIFGFSWSVWRISRDVELGCTYTQEDALTVSLKWAFRPCDDTNGRLTYPPAYSLASTTYWHIRPAQLKFSSMYSKIHKLMHKSLNLPSYKFKKSAHYAPFEWLFGCLLLMVWSRFDRQAIYEKYFYRFKMTTK